MDLSNSPQDQIFEDEIVACKIVLLEKAYGKYMGSKKDSKFRFFTYGNKFTYDFETMTCFK